MKIFKLLINKRYSTIAGAISFFVLLNGWSLMFLILYLFKILDLKENIIIKAPSIISDFFMYYREIALDSIGKKSIILVLSSLFSTSSLFYHLLRAGELIYDKKRNREKVYNRIVSIIFSISFIFLIAAIVIMKIILSRISGGIIYIILNRIITFLLIFLIVSFINYYIVPFRINIKKVLLGSLATTIYWILCGYLFNAIIIFTNYGSIYKGLEIVVVSQLYIYIMSIGLIIGVVINSLLHKDKIIVENNSVHKE